MNSLLIFILAIGLTLALPSKKLHPLSDEYIAEINSKQSTWKAGRNFDVEDYELFRILATGVKRPQGVLKEVRKQIHNEDIDIPESFDSREAWPECADVIGLIRDQSRCGSCWAFAAAEAMSDRICIHSNARRKILVSAQDILSCGIGGCEGGMPFLAWEYWTSGIVTGGLYNQTEQGCKSYFLPNCEDHPNKCTNYVGTPKCVEECDDPNLNYEEQKTYGQTLYSVRGETQIQLEILENGPVEATFDVYTDFANYKSGIYQITDADYEGGHAVKIIGWGVEDNVKYWTIANSWNERWGENGFFRIIRGVDEARIESNIVAALPDFERF